MTTRVFPALPTAWLRHSPWDGLLIGLSLGHAALLMTVPSVPMVAIGLWWNANTISHNFVHLPFFRSRSLNAAYSVFLSAVLGVPQSLWRARHLRHHADSRERGAAAFVVGDGATAAIHRRPRSSPAGSLLFLEIATIAIVWAASATVAPRAFFLMYLPGWALGLGLCQLQGYLEHAHGTTSHYGRIYNLAFFNDGYHVEHHQRPGEHWTRIARPGRQAGRSSPWPPVLRWIESLAPAAWLNGLERIVIHSRTLQSFVLTRHERAFRRLLPPSNAIKRATIVGGGLFPRSALVVRRLFPNVSLRIVDSDAGHLDTARRFLSGAGIEFVHAGYDPASAADADLVVIPLAFTGDRERIYERPPAPVVLVHDWMWSAKAESARVSWLLCKRLNVVRQ
jgi:Fatty acid desaturase